MLKKVVIGLLGTTLDNRGYGPKRWESWRPTVSIFQHEDLQVHRLELLFQSRFAKIAEQAVADIRTVSPETTVVTHGIEWSDPWDFQEVYGALHDFARAYSFDRLNEEYLFHITTGTHVAQICAFLLTEANYLPAKLLQTGPTGRSRGVAGTYQVIDLDLSKYAQIARRFALEHVEGTQFLKGGIETRNEKFNTMVAQLEKVSIRSPEPILLMGPTGAGKTQLASRVYDLKFARGGLTGSLVVINCATLRGDNAMSALFGHKKGAFTGAAANRPGLLVEANGGMLFLDEIGELGQDEQAMLLRAMETKQFLPVGSDREVRSDFQIVAGTNRDLNDAVRDGLFREDLLARIDLWTYRIPSLRERNEDIEPNLQFELDKYAKTHNVLVTFNNDAYRRYLQFALAPAALWAANFRDLNASVIRMATLSEGGRITTALVEQEILTLDEKWARAQGKSRPQKSWVDWLLAAPTAAELDEFDRLQLEGVLGVVARHPSLAAAGRELFYFSRQSKKQANDSHRLRAYLQRFGISNEDLKRLRSAYEP